MGRYIAGLRECRFSVVHFTLLVSLTLVSLAPAAQATTINLTNDGCAKCTVSPAGSPFGTVDFVQDVDGISIDFTITLATDAGTGQPFRFHNSSSIPHPLFAFNLSGSPAITASNFNETPGAWTLSGPGSVAASGSGTFQYTLTNSGPGGYGGGDLSPLTFKITPTTGSLSANSLIANSQHTYFNVDIVNSGDNSGNIWDTTLSLAPEPSTGTVLGVSLLGLLAMVRRQAGSRALRAQSPCRKAGIRVNS